MSKRFLLIICIAICVLLCYCNKQPIIVENNADSNLAETKIEQPIASELSNDTSNLPQNEHNDETKTASTCEPVMDENKLIDEDGCIYYINSTIEFSKSKMLIKKIKLVYDYFAGYLMYIDFDVTNKSDIPVSWRLQHHDNLLGYFSSEMLVNKEIGGNDDSLFDDDIFDSNRKKMGAITLNPKETYSGYKLGIFLNFTKDIKEVRLKEKEPMQIVLYFKENDVRHEFVINLNEP